MPAGVRATPSGWLRRIAARAVAGVAGPRPATAPPPDASVEDPVFEDPWRAARRPEPSEPVSALLSQIEDAAIAVYEAHGLPTRRGSYARPPRGRRWRFIAETLSPEARWALALERPGWRFAVLEDLGRHVSDAAEPRIAARLLTDCRRLRSALRNPNAASRAQDLEIAIRLGAEWRHIERHLARRATSRLVLLPPSGKRGPRART